jgi:uncharacterized protein YcnI
MKKIIAATLMLLGCASLASAHVVVKPSQVGIGAFQTFSTGVPVEKPVPTIGLRLLIPAGLEYVTPNVKPGWKISIKKASTTVTEIEWTGGTIPAGQRDEFVFSARVPKMATSLAWKAYQTYADGTVVSWDQDPASSTAEELKPYSITKVVDDLTPASSMKAGEHSKSSFAVVLSIVSLALSLVALSMVRRRKN